jgi:hypothetical protein
MALPLVPAGELDGDAGYGPSSASAKGTESGIVVTRLRCLSLHSPDLSQEHWRLALEASPGLSVAGARTMTGVIGDHLYEVDIASGEVVDRIPWHGEVAIVGWGPDLVITRRGRTLETIDRAGKVLWRIENEGSRGVVANTADRLIALRDFSYRLSCLSVANGEPLWDFQAKAEYGGGEGDDSAQVIEVAVVGNRVVAVVRNARVFSLSLETGEILKAGRAEFVGIPRISGTSVFFVQPGGYSEFSHLEMAEVSRDEYRDLIPSLYKGPPTVHAFVLTTESLVWTTREGALMGVGRDMKKPRTVWRHLIPGSLMPILRHPFVYRDALYFESTGLVQEARRLVRFVSAGAGKEERS